MGWGGVGWGGVGWGGGGKVPVILHQLFKTEGMGDNIIYDMLYAYVHICYIYIKCYLYYNKKYLDTNFQIKIMSRLFTICLMIIIVNKIKMHRNIGKTSLSRLLKKIR